MSEQPIGVDSKAKKDKKMFLFLALLFVLPFTIAMTMHLLDIRPGGKSNGHLITPIVPMVFPEFEQANGENFGAARWNKIWSLVMVDHASCGEACETNVDKLNRVHRTLYKQEDRVQRILILSGEYDAAKIASLQEKFPKLIVLPAANDEQQQFAAKIVNTAPNSAIYLIDPLNNLMMDYQVDVTPKALRKDMMRLLKNSWSG